jgi:hypothetical protein
VKPKHELKAAGERLKLSMFGEYFPDASLRGYALEELLTKPQHYRPKVIIQMGETVSLNYACKELSIHNVSASLFDEALKLMKDLAEYQNGAPLIWNEEEYNNTMTEVGDVLETNGIQ